MDRIHFDYANMRWTDGHAEGHCDPRSAPYEAGGALLFPAVCCRQGLAEINGSANFIQLELIAASMTGNNLGVFVRLTPEGARHIAAQLIADAIAVENLIAQQAATAIETARQNGARP